MIRCLDIHTHHPAPQPQAVVALSPEAFAPEASQLYSLGFHPWETDTPISEAQWDDFQIKASLPQVAAIGECGVDKLKGGPLYKQLLIFKRQIEISEKLGKPLIIHDVKSHDIITGLKRDLKPAQKWLVHGFRGKPEAAKMLTDAGIYLSFGEKFNPETPASIPEYLLLAETDISPLSIEEVIAQISQCMNRDITEIVARNTATFLFGDSILNIDNEKDI